MHYAYAYRTGSLQRPVLAKEKQCGVEGCEVIGQVGRGMCKRHYSVWWYNNNDVRPVNVDHWKYTDSPTYITVHNRVRRERGRALDHLCVDCGEQAQSWSLKHDAQGKTEFGPEVGSRYSGTFYSLDVMDYEPRCNPCHTEYDTSNGNRKGGGSNGN